MNFISIYGMLFDKIFRQEMHSRIVVAVLRNGGQMELLDELKKVGVDTETGLARFVGKQELYVKFLGKFVQDASYAGLKEAVAKKDYPQAFEHAHSMKGVCGNLSLSPLTEQVGELTEIFRNKESLTDEEEQRVADILPEMEQNYERIIRIISENI